MLQTHFHFRKNDVFELLWQSHNIMEQKERDMTNLLEKQTRHQPGQSSASPQETPNSQLLRAGKHGIRWWCHCTSIRAAPHPLTWYLKPGGSSFINVLTPAGFPWRSAPSWSLLSLQQQEARAGDRLPVPVPSLLPQQHFSISPCVGLLGVLGDARKGRESCSEERSPEDREEGVTIPSNTLLQKPLRKWRLLLSSSSLPPHFPTNSSQLRSTRLVRENGAGRGKRFQSLIKLPHPYPKTSVSHCCVVPLSLSTCSTTLTLTKKNSP